MQDIYRIIIEYKNLYPVLFWIILSLIGVIFILAVAIFFKKANNRKAHNDNSNKKAINPQKPGQKPINTEHTVTQSSKNKTVKTKDEQAKPKEKPSNYEVKKEVNEPITEYEVQDKPTNTEKKNK
jgi:glucan phosphoethanolaminetransferase (alkaline phosphatase superfamily)